MISTFLLTIGTMALLVSLPFLLIGSIALLWVLLILFAFLFYGIFGLPFYIVRKLMRWARRRYLTK